MPLNSTRRTYSLLSDLHKGSVHTLKSGDQGNTDFCKISIRKEFQIRDKRCISARLPVPFLIKGATEQDVIPLYVI
jgi:hypothetical protein